MGRLSPRGLIDGLSVPREVAGLARSVRGEELMEETVPRGARPGDAEGERLRRVEVVTLEESGVDV